MAAMNWKSIRVELACTEEFPRGSAGRSYLLRLPLKEDGLIDEACIKATPADAIIRRFWPNEPDRIGTVKPTPKGLAFSYEPADGDDENMFHLEPSPIRLGEYVTLPEPDGTRLQFRVASLRQAR
jgi:hypothetical protein